MSERKDGGPAFPQIRWEETPIPISGTNMQTPHWYQVSASGMSLRDYFAAAALQGMFANPSLITIVKDGKQLVAKFNKSNIHEAYLSADAMLVERDK